MKKFFKILAAAGALCLLYAVIQYAGRPPVELTWKPYYDGWGGVFTCFVCQTTRGEASSHVPEEIFDAAHAEVVRPCQVGNYDATLYQLEGRGCLYWKVGPQLSYAIEYNLFSMDEDFVFLVAADFPLSPPE